MKSKEIDMTFEQKNKMAEFINDLFRHSSLLRKIALDAVEKIDEGDIVGAKVAIERLGDWHERKILGELRRLEVDLEPANEAAQTC